MKPQQIVEAIRSALLKDGWREVSLPIQNIRELGSVSYTVENGFVHSGTGKLPVKTETWGFPWTFPATTATPDADSR